MANTVVNGINKLPANVATNGEGQAAGEELDITITFTSALSFCRRVTIFSAQKCC